MRTLYAFYSIAMRFQVAFYLRFLGGSSSPSSFSSLQAWWFSMNSSVSWMAACFNISSSNKEVVFRNILKRSLFRLFPFHSNHSQKTLLHGNTGELVLATFVCLFVCLFVFYFAPDSEMNTSSQQRSHEEDTIVQHYTIYDVLLPGPRYTCAGWEAHKPYVEHFKTTITRHIVQKRENILVLLFHPRIKFCLPFTHVIHDFLLYFHMT